jgi:hypothetical protein
MYKVQGCELNFSGSGQSSVAGWCEHGNESLHLNNGGEFHDKVKSYHLPTILF